MQKKMKKLIVTKEHKSTFPYAMIIKVGEKLIVEKKKTNYENWVWVTSKNGISCWMPESFLEIKNCDGIAKEDYDSTELNVKLGEQLSLYREDANWYWVENSKGEFGWVPIDNVEFMKT